MKIIFLLVMLTFSSPIFAVTPTETWLNLLQQCSPSQELGTESLFFGASNLIGPGSLWRFANDKSIRLIFTLSDAFPNASDQAAMIKDGDPHSCGHTVSAHWSLRLGLPFSTAATPLTADIALTLGRARDVTISIEKYKVDAIIEGVWEGKLTDIKNSDYFKRLNQSHAPTLLLAENVASVSKMKAVFNYSSDLSLKAQATLKTKSFTLGNSNVANQNKSDSGDATSTPSTSITKSASDSSSAPPGNTTDLTKCAWETGKDTATSSTKSVADDNNAQPKAQSSTQPSPAPSTNDAKKKSLTTTEAPSSGTATFQIGFDGKRQIIVCVEGPVYILGAYSKIKNGQPLGVSQSDQPSPLLVIPFDVPLETRPRNERKVSAEERSTATRAH